MDLWYKVPIALISSYYFVAGFKPPNPVVKRENLVKIVRGSIIENNWSQYVAYSLGLLHAYFSIAEVALLMTRDAPSSTSARLANWFFVFKGGDAEALRFTTTHLLAGAMMFVGGLIRVQAFKTLGKFFTFQVTIQDDHKLMTSGLYSVVRHPAYGAVLLTQPGAILWNVASGSWVRECGILNSSWGLLLCSMAALRLLAAMYLLPFSRMPQEDRALKENFGKEWEQWAKRVPHRLIPGVY